MVTNIKVNLAYWKMYGLQLQMKKQILPANKYLNFFQQKSLYDIYIPINFPS